MDGEGWTKNCYGYVRVSTKNQADEGLSLEIQRKKIEAWAVMSDYKVIKMFADEGISGTSLEGRKGLLTLLDTIQKGETLVTLAFSRLSRSSRDFLNIVHNLTTKGCRIVIINEGLDTSSPYGRFTATMFSAVAELEAGLIKERVKDAMNMKKENGEFMGRIPYGWRLTDGPGSDLTEVEEEQAIITYIKELRDGKHSNGVQLPYSKISRILNDKNISPSGKSKEWTHTSVSRIYNRKEVITKGRSDERKIKQQKLAEIK
jgi:DNA invertase Pin-like site-specific DNA recombinase